MWRIKWKGTSRVQCFPVCLELLFQEISNEKWEWKRFSSFGPHPLPYVSLSLFISPPLRQNGIGIGSMCARVGGVLAPMLHFLRGVSPMAPMVLCGLCPLLGSALTLMLPETANKHLPDTVEDVEGPDLRCGSASNHCLHS